jgi:GNAT superfamily N-acetyltransferase
VSTASVTSGIVIRTARRDDADSLHCLIEAAYRGPESLTGWTSEGDMVNGQRMTMTQVEAVLADPGITMLVAEDTKGGLIGCASLTETAEGGEFGKFAVRPALQNGGTGKALLAACETLLAKRGGGHMTMTVVQGRPELVAFYERRGYQRTGATLPLASVHTTPDWTIGRDLVLEVFAKTIPAAP